TLGADQLAEVGKLVLAGVELGRRKRERGASYDRALQQRGRVDAHDRVGVDHRIEVVGTRAVVGRISAAGRENGHAWRVVQWLGGPLVAVVRMGTHDDVRLGQAVLVG